MRLFIGIPLSEAVRNVLERLTQSLRTPGDDLRWSSPQSWHITLQFLGETSAEKYECIVPPLKAISSPPLQIQLGSLGFFDRAGVFFADVDVSGEMHGLQKRVTAATSQCGFAAEDRPFHPHVTLARAKGGKKWQSLRNLKSRAMPKSEFPPFTATEFLVYEAFLGAGGSRYEIRERVPLTGSGNL